MIENARKASCDCELQGRSFRVVMICDSGFKPRISLNISADWKAVGLRSRLLPPLQLL